MEKGNRLREEVRDTDGTLRRVTARQYNALGQLSAQINAPYAQLPDLDDPAVRKSTYLYDGNGNQTIATDALGRVSDNRFDELNRLTRAIQDADDGNPGTVNIAATVIYGYDAVGNLRQVIDPNQLVTQYTYDGHDPEVS